MKNPIVSAWYAVFPKKQIDNATRFLESKNLIINLLLNQDHKRLSTVDTLILLDLVEHELDTILKDRYFDAHQEITAIETYRNKKNGKENIETNS